MSGAALPVAETGVAASNNPTVCHRLLAWNARLYATPRRFLLLLSAYVLAHLLLRLLLTSSLGRDDVEQAVFSQSWAWGYSHSQPPLYTWLLAGLAALGVSGLTAHALLRFSLLFLTYWFLFLAARRAVSNPALAALAATTPVVTILFGWEAPDVYTHSLALSASMGALLWSVFRLAAERRTAADYALLGVVGAVGLLSKYAFLLPLVCLLAAALSDATWRARVLDRRFALAVAVAAILVAPHLWWQVDGPSSLNAVVQNTLTVGQPLDLAESAALGFAAIARAGLVYYAGPLALTLIFLPGALIGRRRPDAGVHAESDAAARLLARSFVFVVVAALVAVLALGVNQVETHHMIAPLLWLPVLALARVERRQSRWIWLKGYAAILSLVMLLSTLAHAVKHPIDAASCTRCYRQRPLEQIAEQLRAAGFVSGTIITYTQLLAGGLQPYFPGSRVVTVATEYSLYVPPRDAARDGGHCLIAWERRYNEDLTEDLLPYARATFGVGEEVVVPAPAYVEAPILFAPDRPFAVGYLLLDGSGDCR